MPAKSPGMDAHGLLFLPVHNYLLLMGFEKSLSPWSCLCPSPNNVEFLRRLPKLNAINGFEAYGETEAESAEQRWSRNRGLAGESRALR